MANNITVTITVRDKVSPALSKMHRNTVKQTSAFSRMGTSASRTFSSMARDVDKVVRSGGKLSSLSMKPLSNQFVNMSRTVTSLNRNTNALTQTVARLAATYLGVMGAKAAIATSDTIVSSKNRIGDANGTGWDSKETQQSLDKIYTASQRARTGYTDMMSNVGKSMSLASGAFKDNIDNAIRFQEVMGKAYAVSGASQAEQASSMYQMIQALSSGVLQGDELRSVREGATAAYQAIEKYAQGVLNTDESLKDLASDGQITSDLVVAAILNAGDEIDKRFAKTRMTFGQMWTMFKNDAVKAFEPVSQKLNDILNSDSFRSIASHATVALQYAANAIIVVLNVIQMGIDFCAQHWKIASAIIVFFISLIVTSLVIWALKGAWAFLSVGVHVAWCAAQIVALCVKYLVLAAVAWISALAQGNAFVFVATAIILVIGLIWALVNAHGGAAGEHVSIIGTVVGVIATAVAFVWNVIKAALTVIMGGFGQLWNYVAAFANFFGNVFNDPIASIVHLFGDMVDNCLSMLQALAQAIDAVFGSNLASTVEGWRKGLSSSVDIVAKKYGNGSYQEVMHKFNLPDLKHTSYSGTFAGANKWVNDKTGALKDKVAGLVDKIKDKTTSGVTKVGELPTAAINPDDYSSIGATPAAAGNGGTGGSGSSGSKLKDIADNTKNIDKKMDNIDDNFDYMITLAERDAINRFTTAEIKVEMVNNNAINNDQDIDGIIGTLSSRLREELGVVAAGVHY